MSRYLFVPMAATIVSLISYFHPSFWFGNRAIMIDLFNRENLTSDRASGMWSDGNVFSLLISSIAIRFIIYCFMVNTPAPNGIFAPCVIIGGIIGRLYAEIGNQFLGIAINRRMSAVAGAAAFIGVATRTTSPILVMLEITGDMDYLLPLIITVLVANAIGGVYVMSFFDAVLNLRKLPYLPVLFSSMWYKRTAAEIMEPANTVVNRNSNLIDLLYLLSANASINKDSYVGVVESVENPVLVGSFKIRHAIDYLTSEIQEIESKIKTGSANSDFRLQKFFQALKNEAGVVHVGIT